MSWMFEHVDNFLMRYSTALREVLFWSNLWICTRWAHVKKKKTPGIHTHRLEQTKAEYSFESTIRYQYVTHTTRSNVEQLVKNTLAICSIKASFRLLLLKLWWIRKRNISKSQICSKYLLLLNFNVCQDDCEEASILDFSDVGALLYCRGQSCCSNTRQTAGTEPCDKEKWQTFRGGAGEGRGMEKNNWHINIKTFLL